MASLLALGEAYRILAPRPGRLLPGRRRREQDQPAEHGPAVPVRAAVAAATTPRRRRAGRSTATATAWSSAKAPACWCSKSWSTPGSAARASTPRWSASAPPSTASMHGDGLARAIRAALSEAGIGPEDIDHVNAHGLSTRRDATPGRRAACTRCSATVAAGAGVRRQELHRQPRRRQRHDRAGRQPAGAAARRGAGDAQLRGARPGLPGHGDRRRAAAGDAAVRAEGRLHRDGPVCGGGLSQVER